MSSERFEELELLLLDWEDGTLDESGINRVREILRSDESARQHFVKLQVLTASLHVEANTSHTVEPVRTPPSTTQRRTLWNGWLIAAGVAVVVLATRLVVLESQNAPTTTAVQAPSPTRENTASGIAVVTRTVDAKWNERQQPIAAGDAVSPGRLVLESGLAQVEFFCGATVIIQGPAELELESATRARIHSGRLRAQVPPAARGFTIVAGEMNVVDLGTEFGLSVSDGAANVQVFDGEVELHDGDSEIRNLTTGQAILRSADGDYAETEVDPETFIDVASLETKAKDSRSAKYQRWKTWTETLRTDQRLITLHTFDRAEVNDRRLLASLQPANHDLDGAIVGARTTSGRWPEKTSLEFKRPADRVRVQIPGEFSSLTFAAWVRIDSLDRRFNSLFLTDNYNKGEPHWQILESGQLYFSVRPVAQKQSNLRDFKALSEPFWNPSLSGRWLHLATVYDVDSASITHYLNGTVLSEHKIPRQKLAETTRIGTASLGNWAAPTQPDERFAIRNLNGRIDEFALFKAALSSDEIATIYENGKP
ncbi:MAG: LamG-like jellyroll fold domain-containing protein [Planctomycetaceae bacterium]